MRRLGFIALAAAIGFAGSGEAKTPSATTLEYPTGIVAVVCSRPAVRIGTIMAKAKASLSNVRNIRQSTGLNQSVFWSKFGVTQSAGSRYQSDRNLPAPLKLLMQAWLDNVLDDAMLARLAAKVARSD
ncbi:MAG: hypothetical protein IPI02_12330 [Sterolibacteriaceae bacterium]|nr:hypothetical protein [Sterolibacteriaceae bacterium]